MCKALKSDHFLIIATLIRRITSFRTSGMCKAFKSDINQPNRESDSPWAGRCGDRIPVEVRFSAPVQTSPGAHAASYTMGTWSFPGVMRQGRGVDQALSSSAEVMERVGLSTPPLGFRGLL
jgi:hypothetical protein